jgi:alginate O-acetyltransferase complex protein AlgI
VLFVEFRFLVFFSVVWAVHWALRRNAVRKVWLLLTSYAFYAAWDWRFLFLILAATLISYGVGLGLLRWQQPGRRRLLLAAGIVSTLAILGFFKYWDFFLVSAQRVLVFMGFRVSFHTLGLILPVGISFFTFQALSYAIDVYREKVQPIRNLLDVCLYIGFFPQLVAGPIVRAADFLPQLRTPRRWSMVNLRPALVLLLVGYVQKAVIADNAALIANQYFADPAAYGTPGALLGVFSYSAQIYGDFAGYSNMAIGCAMLLGYWLPLNFNFPYLARNPADLWRRWHISLSTWLRDYLYVPLGGNRGGRLFIYRNLMLTMLIGGLWHGAAWRFVIWGGLHGLALVAYREWARRRPPRPLLPRPLGTALAVAGTFYFTSLAWILFRSPDLTTAARALRGFLFLGGAGSAALSAHNGALTATGVAFALAVLAVVHILNSRGSLSQWRRLPDWAFALTLGASIPAILAIVPPGVVPFIYFQF